MAQQIASSQVARKREIKAALESLDETMQNCDSVGDTRLSGLYHEINTSSRAQYERATAFCDLDEDGELEVTSVCKLRDGQWAPETRDAHDVVITMPVSPFTASDFFCDRVSDDISEKITHINMNIEKHRWAGNID
jgi:hypothetical protein